MYNGIGLQTPRGSGTNGYIQSNKFFVRPKSGRVVVDDGGKGFGANQGTAGVTKKPNKDILEHDRKRQIQLKLVVLEDKLVEQGYTESEIAEKLEEARRNLEAAEAAEELAGVATIDKKVSDTQTHQIAARKEKQLETFRAALGIGTSELGNQKNQINIAYSNSEESGGDDDEPRNSQNKDFNDEGKQNEKDLKDQNDDMRKNFKSKKNEGGGEGLDESRSHKKKESKTRRHRDSSDTSSQGKHARGVKNQKGSQESDSDIDVGKKRHKSTTKHKKSRRNDSDDSDSDDGEKYEKARKMHDSDVDSSSDERPKRKMKKGKRHSKMSRASDSNSDDNEEYEKTCKKHVSDDYDSSYEEGPKHRLRVGKRHMKMGRRHDSEDEFDVVSSEKNKRNELERKRDGQSGSCRIEKDDFVPSDLQKNSSEKHRRIGGRYGVESDFDSEQAGKRKKENVEKSRSWQHDIEGDISDIEKVKKNPTSGRHDSDEDGSDDSETDKSNGISSSSDSGSDTSDYRLEKLDRIKSLEKNQSGRRDDLNSRGGHATSLEKKVFRSSAVGNNDKRREKSGLQNVDNGSDAFKKLEELYQSRRDPVDRSSYGDQERTRGKRKADDRIHDEWPEAKSRTRNVGEERSGEGQKITEIEAKIRAHRSKNNLRRDEDENTERRGRIHSHDEPPRESMSIWDYREHEVRRHSGMEEDQRGRKYTKDEDQKERKYPRDSDEHKERKYTREDDVDKERKYTREDDVDKRREYTREDDEHKRREYRKDEDEHKERKYRRDEDEHKERKYTRDEDKNKERKYTRDEDKHKERKYRRDEDEHKERKYIRDEDEHSERKYIRDEDEHKKRKYTRDDGEKYRRHEKSEEHHHHHESGRRGREEEDVLGSGREESDKRVDSSKRTKYDDSRSAERRHDSDRRRNMS